MRGAEEKWRAFGFGAGRGRRVSLGVRPRRRRRARRRQRSVAPPACDRVRGRVCGRVPMVRRRTPRAYAFPVHKQRGARRARKRGGGEDKRDRRERERQDRKEERRRREVVVIVPELYHLTCYSIAWSDVTITLRVREKEKEKQTRGKSVGVTTVHYRRRSGRPASKYVLRNESTTHHLRSLDRSRSRGPSSCANLHRSRLHRPFCQSKHTCLPPPRRSSGLRSRYLGGERRRSRLS
mmetsp:Transcript_13681/g.58449  ORF Transcript_13681/g.58449 Transcript_13681/m.58449 type:complete len:237 (+) Transcript_13681:825-1535(+)